MEGREVSILNVGNISDAGQQMPDARSQMPDFYHAILWSFGFLEMFVVFHLLSAPEIG